MPQNASHAQLEGFCPQPQCQPTLSTLLLPQSQEGSCSCTISFLPDLLKHHTSISPMLSCLDLAHTDGQLPLLQALVFSSYKAFLTNSFSFFLNHPCCNSLNNFQLVDISKDVQPRAIHRIQVQFQQPQIRRG